MPDLGITWYGTAGLLLQYKDAAIAFDPFAGLPLSKEDAQRRREALKPVYAKASHVFMTHGHVDHIADIPFFYKDSSALVYGTFLPCRTLADGGFPNDRLRIIAPGWQGRAGPFLV
ncbi:MAG: MBL fold metallo-hydrolase, partial [Oscillospiraceae bacterium]|nr:MBL fold metallo-hydrolase [Oscillospiraceae bacterium]